MKISAIRLDRMRLPLDPPFNAAWDPAPRTAFDATLVTVETDEGVVGYGSGDTMDGFEGHENLFLGRDPLAIVNHVKTLETINFHAGRYWPLEAALWDIIGKVSGLPVAGLFGGATDRLPAYASFGELKPPAERAEAALAAKEAGFRAMKIRVARDRLAEGVATARAVREAVGDDVALMVDLNQSWRMSGDIEPALDLASVRRVAAELAELDVLWLEEPLPQYDIAGARTVARRPASASPAVRWCARCRSCCTSWSRTRSTSTSRTSSCRSACCAPVPSPSWRSPSTAGSPRTPGATGSACWRTCTSSRGSAAARTWSSPTTRRAGRRPAGTSS
jgi:L-alanine-DL-glutamate epimerase-like enolase superfamily enzyme